MIRQVVESLNYELVGVELLQRQKAGSLLRVYIDQPDGITVDDCTEVSHRVSGILDVEDPIKGAYHLEISSPGLDRPLFEEQHFDRFAGHILCPLLTLRPTFYGFRRGKRGISAFLEKMNAGGFFSNNILVLMSFYSDIWQ